MAMIREYLDLVCKAIGDLPEDKIQDVVDTLKAAHAGGRQVILLGNGGSAATASHLACDFQKGVKEHTGKRFLATAVAISGSGNSPNVIKAVEKANEMGAITIGWSGYAGGKLAQIAQKSIVVNSDNMQRIEDVHMVLGHLVFTCLMKS